MSYFELNLGLSKEDMVLRDAAHKFAKEVMRPVSIRLDRMGAEEAFAPSSPFWDVMKQAYGLGYHRMPFPEAVGGLELNPLQINVIMEELAWGSFGLVLAMNTSLDASAAMEGGEELIKEFTIPYCQCTDGSYLGCWAITEPDHGSDTLLPGYPCFQDPAIPAQCRAKLDGDEYVISGQKSAWVSNGPIANHILLMCQIDAAKGHAGSGIFIFSLDRPGVSKGKPVYKIGARDLCQGEVYFDEVRVPKKYLLVGPDHYAAALEAHLCMTLPMVGTWAVGLARAAFEEGLAYARQRVQGGKPLIEHNNIKVKLMDLFRKIEASRAICRAVFVHNWSHPLNPERRRIEHAIAAKTFATQTCLEVTSDVIQIFGGNGITKEYPVEKFFRDARTTLICDGSNDTLSVAGGHRVGHTYPRL